MIHYTADRMLVKLMLVFCQVVEGLLRFTTEEILAACEADIHFIHKRVASENGQKVR